MNKQLTYLRSSFLVASLVCSASLALAQGYHYSYGDSRVVNQGQTGLYLPSATYLGPGTLSKSAQGRTAGIGAILPSVNMGSHVRTPGDNLYNDEGTARESNGALVYKDQQAYLRKIQMLKAKRRLRANFNSYGYNNNQQPGYFYIPGQNGSAATYAAQPAMIYQAGGTATYAEQDFSTSANRARQF